MIVRDVLVGVGLLCVAGCSGRAGCSEQTAAPQAKAPLPPHAAPLSPKVVEPSAVSVVEDAAVAEADHAPSLTVAQGVTGEERSLFDILMRLAKDPSALAQLAPKARLVFHSSDGETYRSSIKDPQQEFGWIAQAQVLLVPFAATEAEGELVARCSPNKLRCEIDQPGGVTHYSFARMGKGAQQHIVLRQVEASEP
jgi:hypothetical protein